MDTEWRVRALAVYFETHSCNMAHDGLSPACKLYLLHRGMCHHTWQAGGKGLVLNTRLFMKTFKHKTGRVNSEMNLKTRKKTARHLVHTSNLNTQEVEGREPPDGLLYPKTQSGEMTKGHTSGASWEGTSAALYLLPAPVM